MKDSDEFSFLKETFKSLGSQHFDTSGIIIGPGDDAGLVENNKDTIYSVDASVSGIHFPEDLSPHLIAYRSVSTAASDIAACGGRLKWILVSLTVSNKDLSWMRSFVSGLKNFSDDYSCPVLGGDLTKGAQENISVTACGELNKENFLKRSGAKVGDLIFLTGTLGEAKKGLELIKENMAQIDLTSKFVKKFLSPNLNFEFAAEISAIANSCIDVSDGLISDLGHILEASRVGGEINVERIALVGAVEDALTWGDDYELLITIPSGQKQSLLEISERFDVDISEIGKITRESDLRVIEKGSLISFSKPGYNHFNE